MNQLTSTRSPASGTTFSRERGLRQRSLLGRREEPQQDLARAAVLQDAGQQGLPPLMRFLKEKDGLKGRCLDAIGLDTKLQAGLLWSVDTIDDWLAAGAPAGISRPIADPGNIFPPDLAAMEETLELPDPMQRTITPRSIVTKRQRKRWTGSSGPAL